MRPLQILLTGLSAIIAVCLAVYFWPMSEADVPKYIKVERRLSEPHVSAATPGPGLVVSIAIHNSHPLAQQPVTAVGGLHRRRHGGGCGYL